MTEQTAPTQPVVQDTLMLSVLHATLVRARRERAAWVEGSPTSATYCGREVDVVLPRQRPAHGTD